MPTLHHFPLDPFSRRMRLALAEYGVAFQLSEAKPWEPGAAVMALSPGGQVPVFVEDSGQAVSGIEAMTEYLEETRRSKAALIPGNAGQRAEVRRVMGWFDTKFYAEVSEPVLTEKIVRRFLMPDNGGGAPDMGRLRRGLERLKPHLDYIGHLAETRAWLGGEHLSVADLAAAAHLSTIDFVGDVPWADHGPAKAWYQRIKSRPSFRPLLADGLRGITPPGHYADLDF